MNIIDHDRILRSVLVATINEGLTKQRIILRDDGKTVDLDLDPMTKPFQNPALRFEFTHAEADLHASLAYDKDDGVMIVVVMVNTDPDGPGCSGVVVGRLKPSRTYDDPAALVLDFAVLCCEEPMPTRLSAMKIEDPNGYSLVLQ